MKNLGLLFTLFFLCISSSLIAANGTISGSGTETEPYLIEDLADFDYIVNNYGQFDAGQYLKLTADLNLSGRSYSNFVFPGLSGVFLGNGHTISNLTIINDVPASAPMGFFGLVLGEHSEVNNLNLVNINITGNEYSYHIGGICGQNFMSSIANCMVTGSIDGGDMVGLLVGYNNNGSIHNCSTSGTVSGFEWVGGLVGCLNGDMGAGHIFASCSSANVSGAIYVGGLVGENHYGGYIVNSYASGNVTGIDSSAGLPYIGGFCGYNGGTINKSYSSGLVSADSSAAQSIGGFCGYSEDNGLSSAGPIYSCFWDTDTSGTTYPGDNVTGATGMPTDDMTISAPFINAGWSFADGPTEDIDHPWLMSGYPILSWQPLRSPPLDGDGTQANPYRIHSMSDFELIISDIIDTSIEQHFSLETDLDLSGKTYTNYVFPGLNGVFNGNGHTISNLTIIDDVTASAPMGFFGSINGNHSEVNNLKLVNINITGNENSYSIGGICGNNRFGKVTNCSVSGNITNGTQVGLLIGCDDSGTVYQCSTSGSVSGKTILAGLIGISFNNSSIFQCFSTANVSGEYFIGGFIGFNNSSNIANCYAMGNVSGGQPNLDGARTPGGFCGYNEDGSIEYCYSTGTVTAEDSPAGSYVGGFCGCSENSSSINACFWDTDTSGVTFAGYNSQNAIGLPTADMIISNHYLYAGWDFVDETQNGTDDLWKMDGYPVLYWQGMEPDAFTVPNISGLPQAEAKSNIISAGFMVGDISYEYSSIAENFVISQSLVAGTSYSVSKNIDIVVSLGKFLGGDGTENNPYRIRNIDEFNEISSKSEYWTYGTHIRLDCDLDLSTKTFSTPVFASEHNYNAEFSGVFDGNGHTISNISIETDDTAFGSIGFFPAIHGPDACVTNLTLNNISIEVGDLFYIGGLSGYIDSGTISNCHVNGKIIGGRGTGLLAGVVSNTKISNCSTTGIVSGLEGCGGLIGSTTNNSYVFDSSASVTVSSSDYCSGGLIAYHCEQSQIKNCFSTGNVSSSGDAVGGLVGYNDSYSISTSYSKATVSGNNDVGGLCGHSDGGPISNCYARGSVTGQENVGGFCGYNLNSGIFNCYSTGKVMGSINVGGFFGHSDREECFECFWDTQTSGIDYSTSAIAVGLPTILMQNLDMICYWQFSYLPIIDENDLWIMADYPILYWQANGGITLGNGDGSESNPYRIYNTIDFDYLVSKLNEAPSSSLCYITLEADLDLAGRSYSGYVIPEFAGIFDGKGHTIKNIRINGNPDIFNPIGFISTLRGEDSMIHNLTLENIKAFDGTDFSNYPIGGLCGSITQASIINCHVSGSVSGYMGVGLVTGYVHNGLIEHCSSSGDVSGNSGVGGLIGSSGYYSGHLGSSEIYECYSSASIYGQSYLGGLTGCNYSGIIENSYSTGSVTGLDNSNHVGGLCGDNGGSISNCYSAGGVSVGIRSQYVGGFCGNSSGNISNCFWDVDTSGMQYPGDGVGGAYGFNTEEMQTPDLYLNAGWDFIDETANGTDDIWQMHTYPIFSRQVKTGQVIVPYLIGKQQTEAESAITDAGFVVGEISSYFSNSIPKGSIISQSPMPGTSNDINTKINVVVSAGLLLGGGSGHPDNPYLITNIADFVEFYSSPQYWQQEVYTRLEADLDLSSLGTFNQAPIAYGFIDYAGDEDTEVEFNGFFDGNNHVISNLAVNGAYLCGLFGHIGENGTVQNLSLENASIVSTGKLFLDYFMTLFRFTGGVAGINDGLIQNCSVSGSISGDYQTGGICGMNKYKGRIESCYVSGFVSGVNSVGGICGSNMVEIANCYSAADVAGESSVGGLVGANVNEVTNCYSTGNVSGGDHSFYAGGFCGINRGFIYQCYSIGQVSGDQYVGGFCGDNTNDIISCFWDTQNSGISTSDGGTGKTTDQMQNIATYESFDWPFISKDNPEAPWIMVDFPVLASISGAVAIPDLSQIPFDEFESLLQSSNLQLGNIQYSISPEIPADKVISQVPAQDEYALPGSSVDVIVSVGHPVDLSGQGTEADPYLISNLVEFYTFVYDKDYWAEDIHMKLTTDIDLNPANYGRNTYFAAVIAPDTNSDKSFYQGISYNGVFDGNDHTISNLVIKPQSSNSYLGFFGKTGSTANISNLTIENANISSSDRSYNIGILCGQNCGIINNCHTSGSVSGSIGSDYIGGLCGLNSQGYLDNCYSTADVTSGIYSRAIGGLVAENAGGLISKSYATGKVTGTNSIGGLCGINSDGIIQYCYSSSEIVVLGNGSSIGGLCGYNAFSQIQECYSSSTITAENNVNRIGGLCGDNNEGVISDSYSNTSISCGDDILNVGGFCGENYSGQIVDCYSTGSISHLSNPVYIGGFCGHNKDEILSCFWDIDTSFITSSDGGIGMSTSKMHSTSTYIAAGWSINLPEDNTWLLINNHYPVLARQHQGVVLSGENQVKINLNSSYQFDIEIIAISNTETVWKVGDIDSCQWITSVTPASGTLNNAGDTTSITVNIDSSGLAIGDYTYLLPVKTSSFYTEYFPVNLHVVDFCDMSNFAILAEYWLTDCTPGQPCTNADMHPDGVIDLLDLNVFISNWLHEMVNVENLKVDFETGSVTSYGFRLSGDSDWFVQDNHDFQGKYSLQSGDISDSQSSDIEITSNISQDFTISFAYSVDSESAWDHLSFYIDNVLYGQWSGNCDWQQASYSGKAGIHTFKWSYSKDKSHSEGLDAAWIDDIKIKAGQ